jgi:hypothetical protein
MTLAFAAPESGGLEIEPYADLTQTVVRSMFWFCDEFIPG